MPPPIAARGAPSISSRSASRFGDLGCSAADADIEAIALDWLDESYTIDAPSYPELEPYVLGTLAGLVLRRRDPSLELQREIAEDTTPVAMALEGVEPVAQPDDQPLLVAVEETVRVANRRRASELDRLLRQLADGYHTKLVLPLARMSGSGQAYAIAQLRDCPGQPDSYLGMDAEFEQPSTSASVTVDGRTIVRAGSGVEACGDSSGAFVVPLLWADLSADDDRYWSEEGLAARGIRMCAVEREDGCYQARGSGGFWGGPDASSS